MTRKHLITAAVSAALLIGIADVSAYAAGITLGGLTIGTSDSQASATVGNNTANVNLAQGSGPLVDLSSNGSPTGDGSTTDATINLNNLTNGTAGALATVGNNGSLLGDDSSTTGQVNLGSLLSGLDLGSIGGGLPGDGGLGGLPGGGANNPGGGDDGTGSGDGTGVGGHGGSFSGVFASLSIGDQTAIKLRCRGVLNDPTIYKVDVVNFCRMIVKL